MPKRRLTRVSAPASASGGALLLFVGALALRLVYALELSARSPFWGHPYLDARYYLDWAREILSGNFWGTEVFIRAPGYPYFLALVGSVFHLGAPTIAVTQALLGALSCVLVLDLGTRVWGRKVGLIAGWVCALHGALIYWGGEVLMETLFLFWILAGLDLTLKARATRRLRDWMLAGAFSGLAAVTRPTGLPLLLLLPLSALAWPPEPSGTRGARLRAAAVALAAALVFVGAVTVRNWIVGGDIVPIASHGGINFWTGNNERADGKIVVVPQGVELPPQWKGKDNLIAISVVEAEKETGRKLKPSEVNSFWIHKSLAWMSGHPGDALTLYLRKVYYFWAGCEYTNNEDVYSFRRFSWLLSILLLPLGPVYLPGALIMPLALFGLWICRKEMRRAFPLYGYLGLYLVTLLAFFVSSRHRLPVVPICVLLATAAALRLWETRSPRVAGGGWPAGLGRGRAAALLGLLLLLGVNLGARPAGTIEKFAVFEAAAWEERAHDAEQAGQADAALAEYGQALRVHPQDPALHYQRGLVLGKLGRFAEAEADLRQTLASTPEDPVVQLNLALTCYYEGKKDEARRFLAAAQARGATIDPRLREMLQAP